MRKFVSFILVFCIISVFSLCGIVAGAEESNDNVIFFWPFDGDCSDYSHRMFTADYNEMDPDFDEGKLGQCVLIEGAPIMTDDFPDGIKLDEFTVSFWFNWNGDTTGWGILMSIGPKGQPSHFELNINSSDGANAQLGFYNDGSNGAVIGNIQPGWNHIAAVADSQAVIIYLNGQEIYNGAGINDITELSSVDRKIVFGALQDMSLVFAGKIDEAIFVNSKIDTQLLESLYSNPEEAKAVIISQVEALYPEGYVRPTATPVPTATPAPTTAPETNPPTSQPTSSITEAPADKTEDKGASPVVFIIAAVVVIAAVVAVIVLQKKRSK